MGFNHLRKSFSASKRDEQSYSSFPHEVAGLKNLKVDDSMADDNIVFYTDEVTMDDGIRYIATTNVIESDIDRERDPALKQFAGSDVMAIMPTALTTQDGYFYRKEHIKKAELFHRPIMIVGAPRNHDRYVPFDRQMNDILAIYAFMAASYGYDQENATAEGDSRGAMGSILLQLFAERYGINIPHVDAREPCIPTRQDALRLGKKIVSFVKNEFNAAKNLELSMDELLLHRDTIDPDVFQQLKETVVLVNSNIGPKVKRHPNKEHASDIVVQTGSIMAYPEVWEDSFAEYPNARFHKREGGGHVSLIGRPFLESAAQREEARSTVLHSEHSHRKLGGKAFRQLLDDHRLRHSIAV